MRVRRLMVLFLGTLLLMTGFPARDSAGFSDLAGHWAAGDLAVRPGIPGTNPWKAPSFR